MLNYLSLDGTGRGVGRVVVPQLGCGRIVGPMGMRMGVAGESHGGGEPLDVRKL